MLEQQPTAGKSNVSEAKDRKGRTWSDLCQPSLLLFRKAAGAFLRESAHQLERKRLGETLEQPSVPKWALREMERDFPQGYGGNGARGVALN